jgi:hypothetical protein
MIQFSTYKILRTAPKNSDVTNTFVKVVVYKKLHKKSVAFLYNNNRLRKKSGKQSHSQ